MIDTEAFFSDTALRTETRAFFKYRDVLTAKALLFRAAKYSDTAKRLLSSDAGFPYLQHL